MKLGTRIILSSIFIGLCSASAARAQDLASATRDGVGVDPASVERILTDLRYLADDARQGRGVGTTGLDSAAKYVVWQFKQAGLLPATSDGYTQPFRLDPSAPALAHSGVGAADVLNIVGILPGRGSLATETLVIGAHYDHLGLGGAGSLDPDSLGVVHNGADDNASGTVALLETMRILAGRDMPDARTIVFVAFTAEELGTIGSTHYVKNPVRPNDATYAMINFDMVGRLRDEALIVIGTGSAEEIPALLDSANSDYGFNLKPVDDPWGRSDHSSFYAAKIPVVHFFTDTHADYHRTTDDWEHINVAGIAKIAQFAAHLATTLAVRHDPLTFVDVPQPAPMAGGGYGASLGTIPDMSESPGGVRLTGVRAGSPADQAGIEGGDIIVLIGDHEVKDLYGMTDALRAHKPGDVVIVAVLRDGERIEFEVTLGKRGG
jgi:hypothetical protein